MMSLDTLRRMSAEAAIRCSRRSTLPALPMASGRLNKAIPFFGDYRPQGWGLVDRATLVVPETVPAWKVHDSICQAPYVEVDTSGWGADYEPVLTRYEFLAVVAANPNVGWGLVEQGQFQGVVGAFRRSA